MVSIRIEEGSSYGRISPRLYGHFAEHLGRCCYEGLWVGTDCRTIPHQNGFRLDVLDALKRLPTPMLRWPGGCYADHYHWRDGIGPSAERPIRLGLSCGLKVEDDNALGTHEFLDYCLQIGAEPYLAGNMGSGSVQEMCDWVEYCNASVKTALIRERIGNGRPEPYGVKLWGVGNENWGCGGTYDAHSYGLEYRRYATMLKHVDGGLELVAGGHEKSWNQILAHTLRDHFGLANHFSIHRYWIGGGPGTAFSDDDYYRLLAEADATELFVKETRDILKEYDPEGKVGIALDEWGVWHPEARPWGPGGQPGWEGDYSQAATMRDAVATAVALEGFHRQASSLSLANLAQIVNVLHAPIQTDGDQMWLTPTYYVLLIHAPHLGAEALQTELEGVESLPGGNPSVSATASRSQDGLALTVVNRHIRDSVQVQIPTWAKTFELVTGPSPTAANSALDPNAVGVRRIYSTEEIVELPPHSVATATSRPSNP